ncbi:MAG TPA: hypothetical protein VKX31_07520 [Brumimicrobium sp.]|nr:hypothetical protein [Brumimicrobium sp.]
MANTYSIAPKMAEDKQGPSKQVLMSILNYSKSLEVKSLKNESVLVHLN